LRNDLRAIASGTGNINELNLKNLPRNVDIKEGDILVTSGMGGHFPEGYPVAKVTRFTNEEQSPFAEIKAEPLATLDRLRYVLLLWQDAKAMGPLAVMSPVSAATPTVSVTNQTTSPQASEKKVAATDHKQAANKIVRQRADKIKTAASTASVKVKHQNE
jgi:rod shape-determining protein MreC